MREKITDFISDLEDFYQDNQSEQYAGLVDNLSMALDELDSKIAANLKCEALKYEKNE